MDLWRRYHGNPASQGEKLEREMNAMQAEFDRVKKKKADEDHLRLVDRMAWCRNRYGDNKWHDLFRPVKKGKVRITDSMA